MNLQYNNAIELVAAFFAWTNSDQLKMNNLFNQVPEELQKWKNDVDEIFPEYFLEQSKVLGSEFLLLIFSLMKIIVMKSINTPEELLDFLNKMNGKELVFYVIHGENFQYTMDELLSNPQLSKDAISHSHGTVRPKEIERFEDFLKHFDFYLNQLRINLSLFYDKAILPFQSEVTDKMLSILAYEKNEAQENPKDFMETRLYLKNEKKENAPDIIYLSYYDCLDCLFIDNPSIALYGWKNTNFPNNPEIEEILNILTDETRRNILKKLAKKPMFNREIAETCNLSPSTVSYHMTRFYSLGLINFRSGSRKRIYHELNKKRLSQMIDLVKFDLIGEDFKE